MTEINDKSAAATEEPRQWYALQTRSRHEKQVALRIAAQSVETFLPVHCSRHTWKNGVHASVELPLFPGYLFARANKYDRFTISRLPGVVGFAPSSAHPTAIAATDMEILRKAAAQLRAEPHPYLAVGDWVRIAESRPLSRQKRWRLREIVSRATLPPLVEPELATPARNPPFSKRGSECACGANHL